MSDVELEFVWKSLSDLVQFEMALEEGDRKRVEEGGFRKGYKKIHL